MTTRSLALSLCLALAGGVGAAPTALAEDGRPAGAPAAAAPGPKADPTLLTDVRVGIAFQDRLAETLPAAGLRKMFEDLARSSPDEPMLSFLAGRAVGGPEGCARMRAALERRLGLPVTEREQIGAGWFALARRQAECGRLGDALESAGFALRLAPDARTYALLGWVQQRQGHVPEAVTAFGEAVRRNPRDVSSRLALTDLLIRDGRVEQALHVARGTMVVAPRSALGQLYWGTALSLSGNVEDARRAYARALRLAGDDPDQIAAVSAALRRIDGQELAYVTLLRVHSLHRDHRALTVELATLLIETGRHGAAAEVLGRALEADPKDAALWFLHGMAGDAADAPKDAAARYQKAVRLDPDRASYRLALGAAQQRSGDGAAALETYRAAAERFPDDRLAREMYARALLSEGDHPDAEREFKALHEMSPKDPNPCYFLAVVTGLHLGRTTEARSWLERYAALGGTEPAALQWLDQLRKTVR